MFTYLQVCHSGINQLEQQSLRLVHCEQGAAHRVYSSQDLNFLPTLTWCEDDHNSRWWSFRGQSISRESDHEFCKQYTAV